VGTGVVRRWQEKKASSLGMSRESRQLGLVVELVSRADEPKVIESIVKEQTGAAVGTFAANRLVAFRIKVARAGYKFAVVLVAYKHPCSG
jgi:hypothetical protein